MNKFKSLTIARQLLFRPVSRPAMLKQDRLNPLPVDRNPFDPIRRLGTLDDRHLHQRLKDLRVLAAVRKGPIMAALVPPEIVSTAE